ncbi:MAG TPA: ClpXP protease specificity-enhancing factor SspB [Acetobacteraceae bacterium]|nr:ClpXP protease specificity-enhancing factor SspB [Acetobacteraceae bacterium]
MDEKEASAKQSLLPYDTWAAEALRGVAVAALAHVARHGLPGGHHFYLTFRTDHPGVELPQHLRQRFPEEMTIVLQHQFWDLAVDEAAQRFRVGLSFGGVPATLVVPFAALTALVDPEVQFGLSFKPVPAETTDAVPSTPPAEEAPSSEPEKEAEELPQVVSLDAFRRRPGTKE